MRITLEIETADNGISVREIGGKKLHVFNKRGSFINFFDAMWREHVDHLFVQLKDQP